MTSSSVRKIFFTQRVVRH